MSDIFEVVAESISGSQWGFGIDPQWVPALAYDIVHGLKCAGFPVSVGATFSKNWMDSIHDFVTEDLD